MSIHPGNLPTWTVIAIAGCALMLSGCQDNGSDTTAVMGAVATPSTPPEDPLAGAPAQSSCHRMTADGALAPTETAAPVDCDSRHTAVTFHVGLFAEGTVAFEDDVVGRGCMTGLLRTLDITRRQLEGSLISWVWFEPTTAQRSAGARWFRCDLVAWNFDETRLLPLPSGSTPFASGLPDDFQRCLALTSGDVARPVTCDRSHDYRWAGSFRAKVRKSPDRDAALRLAGKPCARMTGQTDGWYITWPADESWARGNHTITCYRRTTR
jgi:Septum formation